MEKRVRLRLRLRIKAAMALIHEIRIFGIDYVVRY